MGKRRTWSLLDEEVEDDNASMCVGSSHSEDARTGTVIEECSWDLDRELGRYEEDRAALPASILLPDLSIAVGYTIKEVYAHISFWS